jgi:hypothetical protein
MTTFKAGFERLTGSQLELSKEFQQIQLRETAETRMGANWDCALKTKARGRCKRMTPKRRKGGK